jgi:aminopeptidase N
MTNPKVKEAVEPIIYDIAGNDKKSEVRARAISILSTYISKPQYKTLFARALNDSSYSVYGAALEAITVVDSARAMSEIRKLRSAPVNKKLSKIVTKILTESANEEDFDMIGSTFDKLPFGQEKFEALPSFAKFVGKVNDLEKFKKGINMITSFRDAIPEAYQGNTTPYINNVILGGIANQKSALLKGNNNSTSIQAQIDYLKSKTEVKKSF